MNTPSVRRYDLDWMRILAILIVFFFHSMRFFNFDDWQVKNSHMYALPGSIIHYMDQWMMPFIFLISGAALYYALGNGKVLNTAGKFIKDKVLRLVVPLVFNALTLLFIQVYLDRTVHGQFTGSMIEFIPHYFDGIYGIGTGNFPLFGMHLWYLLFLFAFSIALLPVFMLLKSRIGSRVLGWVTKAAALPGGIYVLALLVVTAYKLIDPDGILGFDGFGALPWNLGVYSSFLVFGFVIMSSEKLQRSIVQLRWISLALAIGISVWFFKTDEHTDLVAWSVVLAFLGFGMKYLNVEKPALKYASEAVLPFYILHQTVLLGVGYFVVQLAIPDLLKWAIIAIISLAVILGTYEYLVRRINVLRFLFGMKLLKKAPRPVAVPAGTMPQKV